MRKFACIALATFAVACATPSSDLTDANRCGPDALAVAFTAAGRPTTPEELATTTLTPGLGGTLPEDMVGATRRAGLEPKVLRSLHELRTAASHASGPIIILENRRTSFLPQWHYRIVSPQEIATPEFQRDWRKDGAWGLIVIPRL